METVQICNQCGAALAKDAPEGLCPKCLVKPGLMNEVSTSPRRTIVVTASQLLSEPTTQPSIAAPERSQQFGGYRIIRPMGKGGMGAIFEAEEIESGRRVALKVLTHSLDSPEACKRFLREGRLAASETLPLTTQTWISALLFRKQVALSSLHGCVASLNEARSRSIGVPLPLHARRFGFHHCGACWWGAVFAPHTNRHRDPASRPGFPMAKLEPRSHYLVSGPHHAAGSSRSGRIKVHTIIAHSHSCRCDRGSLDAAARATGSSPWDLAGSEITVRMRL